jgi:hypothetical protein
MKPDSYHPVAVLRHFANPVSLLGRIEYCIVNSACDDAAALVEQATRGSPFEPSLMPLEEDWTEFRCSLGVSSAQLLDSLRFDLKIDSTGVSHLAIGIR